MIIIGGNVSGGHFNPAVTLGVFVNEKKPGQDAVLAIMIWISQFTGGLVGALLAWSVEGFFTSNYNSTDGNIPSAWLPFVYPQDSSGTSPATTDRSMQTFFIQAMMTFVFVLTILVVKSKETEPSDIPAIGAMTVAFALMACVFVGTRGGPCYNPAVALGFILTVQTQTENPDTYNAYWWCYIFAPFVGGLVAGLVSLMHRSVVSNGNTKGSPIAMD